MYFVIGYLLFVIIICYIIDNIIIISFRRYFEVQIEYSKVLVERPV